MANEPRTPRLAVLIDADNASSRIAPRLFEEIAKIGEASVRRIYGDFSGTRLKSWADVLATHAIKAHQNFAYNLGDDADTTAAIAGQLAGAIYGASSIRQSWLDKLAWRDEIKSLARRLAFPTASRLSGTQS